MNFPTKTYELTSRDEEDRIDRKMIVWVNTFPGKPEKVPKIDYEMLLRTPSMALSTIQSPYITKRYIYGGYQAEYQFKLLYRKKINIAEGDDGRLSAIETLNRFGDWATTQRPVIGDGLTAQRIVVTSRASLFAAYNNNDEDYQILLKMIYERM